MSSRIYLSPPHMSGNELSYVHQAFEENWISTAGKNIEAFEKVISEYSGASHSAALSSGTAALHLALILCGVQAGDEVICSSFTFAASANPILYQHAVPVFVDSEPQSWNMSPAALEEALRDRISKGKKPKAIILVHLYGQPAMLDEIISIAKKYEIDLIEDAAESFGSTYKGKMTGSFGKMGVYSFNGNKIITTSGGGALVSDDEKLIHEARFLSTQARDKATWYEHSQTGYNYRISNVLAGIGLGQMKVISERVSQRRKNFEFYRNAFKNISGISFQQEAPDTFSNRWLTAILLEGKDPESLRLALEKENIESRRLWKPLHTQPVFKKYPYYGDGISEALFEKGLCLPSGSTLKEENLERITNLVRKETSNQ